MNSSLLFHGAARTVTGSMHFVFHAGQWIALDCGLFQGRRRIAEQKNRTHPPVPVERIAAVLLSHAHIDHAGRIPLLTRLGYRGPVWCTPATRDLAAIMLADSAKIQAEDARFVNKRSSKGTVEPLYTIEDARAALQQFRTVPYDQPFCPASGVVAVFRDAGHMLGSASIVLELVNPPHTADRGSPADAASPRADPFCPRISDLNSLPHDAHRIVYSGDLGRPRSPLLRDAAPMVPAHTIICESTYGGRTHATHGDPMERLADVIGRTTRRGGKVLIPSFAVGRVQTVLYELLQLDRQNRMPRVPVFVDSPLATAATSIFQAHQDLFDEQTLDLIDALDEQPPGFPIEHIREAARSKQLNGDSRPMVLIAPSGMCESGRILHHLRNNIENPACSIVMVGYCGPETLGRRIVEREPTVRIFGEPFSLKADVEVINGLSGHMDAAELLNWIRPQAPTLQRICLVHGDEDQAQKLSQRLRSDTGYAGRLYVPADGQSVQLHPTTTD